MNWINKSMNWNHLKIIVKSIKTKFKDMNIRQQKMVLEEYDYKGYYFQRLNKDYLWYVTYDNKIFSWSQYRYDLESEVDRDIEDRTKLNPIKNLKQELSHELSHELYQELSLELDQELYRELLEELSQELNQELNTELKQML